MTEALFESGQTSSGSRFDGFDDEILDLIKGSDVGHFTAVTIPHVSSDFAQHLGDHDSSDPLIQALPTSVEGLRSTRKAYRIYQSLVASLGDDELHVKSQNRTHVLASDQGDGHGAYIDTDFDGPDGSMVGSSDSNGSTSSGEKTSLAIEFDPKSARSILAAGLRLANPLVAVVGRQARDFAAPVPVMDGQKLMPSISVDSNLPNDVRSKLRAASGLPDGPIVPPALAEAGYKALEVVQENRTRVMAGTAIPVSVALALTLTPAAARQTTTRDALQQIQHRNPIVSAPLQKQEPIVAELVSVDVAYIPSAATHKNSVELDLGATRQSLSVSKGEYSQNAVIPAGTKLEGTVQASRVKLFAPVAVDQLATAYGMSTDAVRSVNTVNEHGLISGEAFIPGRLVVTLPEETAVDTAEIAQTMKLGPKSTRELSRINEYAPDGQVVLKLPDILESSDDDVQALVAEIIPMPSDEGGTTTTPTTSSPTPTSLGVPTTLSNTVATSSSSPATTTSPSSSTSSPSSTTSTILPATTTIPTPVTIGPAIETTPAPEVIPSPVVVERLANPAEQLQAERLAIGQAVEHARATGDAGPLKHLVAYSPLFEPTSLPDNLKEPNIRQMPAANMLGIPGILYEFSQETPLNERVASIDVIVSNLVLAYSMQYEITTDPSLNYLDGSCVRFNDFSASEGHKTHDGDEADVTSALHCDVMHGRSLADGPVLWINRTTGSVNQQITNPNYNAALDKKLLQYLLNLEVDGSKIVGQIYYNAPMFVGDERVAVLSNHSNHLHLGDSNNAHHADSAIKQWADGGGRPELDLSNTERELYLLYAGGKGVPGVSLGLTISEELPAEPTPSPEALPTPTAPVDELPVVEATSQSVAPTDPAQALLEQVANPTMGLQHAFVRTILMNEIASGEGGYDSTNRGVAGDTKVGDRNYQSIFGDRMLSQHTIAELMQLQAEDKIFTVGKYQFIPDTFRSAVQATGIDVNRVFDVATQEELAVNYLIFMKRENLVAYIHGDDSKLYLAVDDLCKEFASMPCNDGTGNYDGDSAGNAAHGGKARVAWIREILKQLQITYLGAQMEIAADQQASQTASAT